ncbi:MAG: hypothetical protein ACW98X_03465 [Promethearchaeota archaeon]
MIRDSSIEDNARDITKFKVNITNILDRAVKLFRRTDLPELADKWDKILNTYRSKKKTA